MEGVTKARPRGIHRLTAREIESWIAKKRRNDSSASFNLTDGGGLYLMMLPSGTAVWQRSYRFGGKERTYSAGPYPGVGLAAARAASEWVNATLREGKDPVTARRVSRAAAAAATAQDLKGVTAEWLTLRRRDWSDIHYEKSTRALERDILPKLGRLPIAEIDTAMIATAIKRIDERGAHDTARKILQHVAAIFRYAKAKGLRQDNPADAAGEILARRKRTDEGRRPALQSFEALGAVLRDANVARLSPAVRMAHRTIAFTVARIANVVAADWREFNLDADVPTWIIPRAKMKAKGRVHDFKIILGPTIARELREWRDNVGARGLVFVSPTSDRKGITREAIEKAYRVTLGLEDKHTPHGWRAALSTLARDNGFERDVVELTLDHVHDNDVVRAYDRGERLKQRIALMNWWDAQLIAAQRGAKVLPLRVA
jgi:integrase